MDFATMRGAKAEHSGAYVRLLQRSRGAKDTFAARRIILRCALGRVLGPLVVGFVLRPHSHVASLAFLPTGNGQLTTTTKKPGSRASTPLAAVHTYYVRIHFWAKGPVAHCTGLHQPPSSLAPHGQRDAIITRS